MPVYHYLKTLFYIDPKAIPPVLLAYLLGKCWEKHLKPVRGKWLRDSNLSLARASTSHPPTSLVKRSWHINQADGTTQHNFKRMGMGLG
jgi:hypothetical protein